MWFPLNKQPNLNVTNVNYRLIINFHCDEDSVCDGVFSFPHYTWRKLVTQGDILNEGFPSPIDMLTRIKFGILSAKWGGNILAAALNQAYNYRGTCYGHLPISKRHSFR